MKIELEPLSRQSDADVVKEIYMTSFPAEERRPWSDLLARSRGGELDLLVIKADGSPVGLITLWHLSGVRYIEHFAVAESLRGAGVGASVIQRVMSLDGGTPVVLEVEPAGSSPMADRRIRFYCRQGFTALDGFEYVQPPYGPALPWVPLMLMASGDIDASAVSEELHRVVYGVTGRCCGDYAVSRDA